YSFAFHPLNICKILPRRRGSGSDEVDDEGVENESTENRENLLAMNISQLPPQRGALLVPLQSGTAI
ncbi:MAG: hypothetical protein IJB60_09335, partial [Bacteroidaceae bacterium]|nr:hypothetical protein [Bacteroidaceae bacterium]